jgi:hypothetical protein
MNDIEKPIETVELSKEEVEVPIDIPAVGEGICI